MCPDPDHPSDPFGSESSIPLRSLLHQAPVLVPAGCALGDALSRLHETGVDALVVLRADRAAGILALSDLPGRVLLPRVSLDVSVDDVMTRDVPVLDADIDADAAAAEMARQRVSHVLVRERSGALLGVVSRKDLPARPPPLRRIAQAPDAGALERVARAVREHGMSMLRGGASAEVLMRHMAALNDALAVRAIELVLASHEDAPAFDGVRWCWLAFGSEGRMEQTFSTDQDNGLVFQPPDGVAADALRPALLRVAEAINRLLERLGFPLCDGGIMAGRPRCCLSLDEWRSGFSNWIATPQPEALLAASIFFDVRALHGDAGLVDELRSHISRRAQDAPLFLRLMATNALAVRPPLDMMRRFRVDGVPGAPRSLDLKAGARIFIDCARALALRDGAPASSTRERLRGLAGEGMGSVLKAFHFIQQLRLARQADAPAPPSRAVANRIDPATLDDLDRVMLRQAFMQARHLQNRVRLDWQLR